MSACLQSQHWLQQKWGRAWSRLEQGRAILLHLSKRNGWEDGCRSGSSQLMLSWCNRSHITNYFLQLGNYFWPEVLHILADSSCYNSFVLLATRCFVLCSGNSLPNSHHGARRAQSWLRGEQQQMRTHLLHEGITEKLLFSFPSFLGEQGPPVCQMLGTTPEKTG